MHSPRMFLCVTVAIILLTGSATAAMFVVPPDRELIHRADAIVVGSALVSYSRPTSDGGIETVTSISVEEIIKGRQIASTINVVEPGGVFGSNASLISGVPRFTEGQRMLLLLNRTGADRWAATELVLGKFVFQTDGQETLLLRDAADIVGWDPELRPYAEPRRSASQFLQFVHDEVGGRMPRANYLTESAAPVAPSSTGSPRFVAAPKFIATGLAFTANSYTMIMSGTSGGRWTVFPSGVNWFTGTTQEPGAPGGGATAVSVAFASWNNDSGSNVNYVYAGADNGTHTLGLKGTDGANTVLFERDLSSSGVAPFTCSGSSYSGTLGIGGVTQASGTHTLNGETFWTFREADVEMNRGIANCTTLFSNGDWNSAVTHEVGHTLGFRHSDQNRSSNGPCGAGMECSSAAIMTSVVTHGVNGALQPWDTNAVRAVYPGATNPPPPPPPPPPVVVSDRSINADFDGDGRADRVIFRPSNSQWWVLRSSGGSSVVGWGLSGDIPVAGDYDGDGKADYAVFRPSNSRWYILRSTGGSSVIGWGITGDIPVPGDYDGDGKTDCAIWRPANAQWWVLKSSTGTASVTGWGLPGDKPVQADYDGDGKTDYAVWRTSNGVWYVINSATGMVLTVGWGIPGDIPVPTDFDGDGKADCAVYRPSTLTYWINRSSGGTYGQQWGLTGDAPVIGDFNGDGRRDYGVWRPSNATWFVRHSNDNTVSIVGWGTSGDLPVSEMSGR